MSRGSLSFILVWCLLGVAGICDSTSEPSPKAVTKGAGVNPQDAGCRTVPMYASFNGHTKCVRWLIDRGTAIGIREDQGRSMLIFASTGPFSETVRLLLESGANPSDKDFDGDIAADHTAKSHRPEVEAALRQMP